MVIPRSEDVNAWTRYIDWLVLRKALCARLLTSR